MLCWNFPLLFYAPSGELPAVPDSNRSKNRGTKSRGGRFMGSAS